MYYGALGAAFTCERCMHIELGHGAKWKLVYQFTQSGPFAAHYVNRYTQVMPVWLHDSMCDLLNNAGTSYCVAIFVVAVAFLLYAKCSG